MKKIVLIFLLVTSVNFSQELNCNVIVSYESLPMNNRDLLRDFASVVRDYMNKTQFWNLPWEGDKIDCTLNINFISASSDVSYSAQIVVVSQRPVYQSTNNSQILKINDALWSFNYEVGQSMYAD
ncbi:MAG: type IX secretion component PorD family protein, partial [Candidatus Kariarchaeaceae archaeon]